MKVEMERDFDVIVKSTTRGILVTNEKVHGDGDRLAATHPNSL